MGYKKADSCSAEDITKVMDTEIDAGIADGDRKKSKHKTHEPVAIDITQKSDKTADVGRMAGHKTVVTTMIIIDIVKHWGQYEIVGRTGTRYQRLDDT